MARSTSLDSVIVEIFMNSDYYSKKISFCRDTSSSFKLYMEIPINSDVFELPLFAHEAFIETLKRGMDCDTLVAKIFACSNSSSYKSLDAIMKATLSTKFFHHLCEVTIPGSPNKYYTTFGTVFDANLKPLMMLSWILERKRDEEGKVKYHYIKPLLRLDPYPCINKEDVLQRWLSSKMLITSLSTAFPTPYQYSLDEYFDQEGSRYTVNRHHVKVEIDKCPFVFRRPDIPSISVTNKDLLQLVASHIDEIIQ